MPSSAFPHTNSFARRFLLRYVSRDEVALLDRGTGGVPDVRNAIDAYEETSPLYGFLQYRRRKVVLSYMPEGLSRLIQGAPNPLISKPPGRTSPANQIALSPLQPVPPSNSSRFWTSSPRMTPSSPYRKPPNSLRAPCRPHVCYIPHQVPSPPRRAPSAAGD